MSESVTDGEYGTVLSPQENGLKEKCDRSKDLEDFCVETIVFENKESILDAVLSVSNGEPSTREGLLEKSEHLTQNGHYKTPSTETTKENVIVSEYMISSNECILENGYQKDEGGTTKETCPVLENTELTRKENKSEVSQDDCAPENGQVNSSAQEIRFEIASTEDFCNGVQASEAGIKQTDTAVENYEVKNGLAGVDLLEGVNDKLANGHDLSVEEGGEEPEKVVSEESIATESESTDVIDKEGEKQKDGEDTRNDDKEDATTNDDEEKDGDGSVLDFIRRKSRSLGRNVKNVRLSSKSDEGQLVETSVKKNAFFKMFSKDKGKDGDETTTKELDQEMEGEFEGNSEDKTSKSDTKVVAQETAKQDNIAFKLFKSVFSKADKKTRQGAGDKGGVTDSTDDKPSNGDIPLPDKREVSTENVVPTYDHMSHSNATPTSKLATISELDGEKIVVEGVKEFADVSESRLSQEGYGLAEELAKDEGKLFEEMVNRNFNGAVGGGDGGGFLQQEGVEGDGGEEKEVVVAGDEDVVEVTQVEDAVVGDVGKGDDGVDDVLVSEDLLGVERGETSPDVVVEDVFVGGGEEREVVEESETERKEDPEMKEGGEEVKDGGEEVKDGGEEVKDGGEEIKKEVEEVMEMANGGAVSTGNAVTDSSQLVAEASVESVPTMEQGTKKVSEVVSEDDEGPKKVKKKNFVLTLPSFKFSAFSKGEAGERGTRREERRSVDDLDKVPKTKKIKKRTKSFHFGKRIKKVDEEVVKEVEEEVKEVLVSDGKQLGEEDAVKSDHKSRFSTLKWRKSSKKTDKKDEITESKDSKESKESGKEEDKHNTSKTSKQSRQGPLKKSFLKFFSRKDNRANDLNGMVYSLEDNMVIAADKPVMCGGSCEAGEVEETDKPFVVVAVDFGTTFSGYAFSFMHDCSSDEQQQHGIHIMRKWEGGDPGVNNQKTPTIILLTPNQDFHTFGFTARDFYHNLDATESSKWLYFDKFKMALHNMDIHENLMIAAANGVQVSALKLFSFALKYFRDHAVKELTSQSETEIKTEDIRWVITVPAIWKAPAKQFMRKAAHLAEITSVEASSKLLIALEPEAASIYIRRLRMNQLVPAKPTPAFQPSSSERRSLSSPKQRGGSGGGGGGGGGNAVATEVIDDQLKSGTRYIVVDCGGGTVDLTVHEMERDGGLLRELYKATGGPYGSTGVDQEFEKLLRNIFGSEFIDAFKTKRPAGWVDLMIAFECRKRTCSPFRDHQHNISMPFSFIDFHKKFFHSTPIDEVVRRHNDSNIKWSAQGMLRLSAEAMSALFESTIASIIGLISNVVTKSLVQGIEFLFLVGGFAESPLLQSEVRKHFEGQVKVIIPQDVSLTILRGAVCYGLDPTVVSLRRSHLTYGIGVVHKFLHGEHDPKKLVRRDGVEWCADVFDGFVKNNQPVALNDSVVRRYAAVGKQDCVTICVYSSDEREVKYVSDAGVRKCATLTLKFDEEEKKGGEGGGGGGGETREEEEEKGGEGNEEKKGEGRKEEGVANGGVKGACKLDGVVEDRSGMRQIEAVMTFGDTEIKVTALEVGTGKSVKATIDFLNL